MKKNGVGRFSLQKLRMVKEILKAEAKGICGLIHTGFFPPNFVYGHDSELPNL